MFKPVPFFASLVMLAACGPGSSPDGGGGTDVTNPSGDSGTPGMDAASGDDAATMEDARRQRDVAEVSTGGMCATCFVTANMNRGPSGTTVMVRGTGYAPSFDMMYQSVTVFLGATNACDVPVSGTTGMMIREDPDTSMPGCFGFTGSVTINQPPGTYFICARQADFSCSAWAQFQVQ